MGPQLGVALSVIIVSFVMFISSLLFKDIEGDKPARFAFRIFYFCAAVFFIAISAQFNQPIAMLDILGDACVAIGNASLAIGILWRCKSTISSHVIALLAVIYFISDFYVDENSIQVAYAYVMICSLICVYALLNRKQGSNVGDKGMAIIILINAVLLLVNLISFYGLIERGAYNQFTTTVFIFIPAYLAGLTIFLFSSYMLDAHQALKIQATTDPMTDLYNRRFFLREAKRVLQSAARHQEPICVMMCDIDHFKKINDSFGHEIGDIAIRAFAKVLTKSLRAGDILARYGGEEFVALLPQTSYQQALHVAERMRHETEHLPIATEQGVIRLTASFGVCDVTNYQKIEVSINQADKAMYQAKSDGRNIVKGFVDSFA